MREDNKGLAKYIDELEDKIIDLSLKLKAKKNELHIVQSENYSRIQKAIHNIKNPIGVAYSFAEILANVESISSHEKHKKYIEIIEVSNNFSIQILNSLGHINELKSPNFNLDCTTISFTNLLTTVIGNYKNEAKNKQIYISKTLPKKELFLTIDKSEIEFVIQTIMNNALRYSSKNSTITIETVELKNTIETTITDEGKGISETDIKTVFNEFSAINTYDNFNKKCIGLGLAIAKNIIRHHNGSIAINSTLNLGTAVKISIPKK